MTWKPSDIEKAAKKPPAIQRLWTPSEDEELRTRWNNREPSKEIGTALGRSSASVLGRANILRLPRRAQRTLVGPPTTRYRTKTVPAESYSEPRKERATPSLAPTPLIDAIGSTQNLTIADERRGAAAFAMLVSLGRKRAKAAARSAVKS